MFVLENFINPEFIDNVLKENQELIYEDVWKSNLGWQYDIVSSTGLVLIRSLSNLQKEQLLLALRNARIISPDDQIELDALAYVWHKLSYIPWHSDKEYNDEVRYAATLYLNRQWNDDWGGLFLYKKDKKIFAEAPAFNKLVFNDNNYEHATSILSTQAPCRYTIQLFWKLNL